MANEKIKPHEPLAVDLVEDPTEYIYQVFTYFLQGWFGHDNYVGTGMHWLGSPSGDIVSDETTEMVITAKRPNSQETENTPHVVLIQGASQWAGLSIDQRQRIEASDGRTTHTDLVSSTISFHCMAKDGALASRIASHIAFAIVALRKVIMRGGGLFDVRPTPQISGETSPGALEPATEDTDLVSVVVVVPFYWQPQWRITNQAPMLRNMRMTLQSRTRAIQAPSGRRIRGWQLPDAAASTDDIVQVASVEGES